jgi:hypothetical protein
MAWYDFNSRDRVKVVSQDDEFCMSKYLGQIGTITKIHYGTAGVGDSREDPFAGVKLDSGENNGFWLSELSKNLNAVPSRPQFKKPDIILLGGTECG